MSGSLALYQKLRKDQTFFRSKGIVPMNTGTVAITNYGGLMKNVKMGRIPSIAPQFGFYSHVL